ncbi:MAG: hypothetical protein IT234_07060 [Bacteroidia bacterium]|nr:hypothetical protein [Bacteroidia bacterium]
MEYIGKRISIKKKENHEWSIVIISTTEKVKNILLFAWLFAWSVSGVIVFTQYFTVPDPDTRVAIMVWMGFWAYFEYKIVKAFLWRKYGVEKIKLHEGKLFYKRDVAGRGKIKVYDAEFIKDLRVVEAKENSFLENVNNSYWVVGGEKIAFDYYGKEIKIGIQLEKPDADALVKLIKKKFSYKN